jgi:hypothetical protein
VTDVNFKLVRRLPLSMYESMGARVVKIMMR